MPKNDKKKWEDFYFSYYRNDLARKKGRLHEHISTPDRQALNRKRSKRNFSEISSPTLNLRNIVVSDQRKKSQLSDEIDN